MPLITLNERKRKEGKVETGPVSVNTDRIVHVKDHFELVGANPQTLQKNGASITLDVGFDDHYERERLNVSETREEVEERANKAIVEMYRRVIGSGLALQMEYK